MYNVSVVALTATVERYVNHVESVPANHKNVCYFLCVIYCSSCPSASGISWIICGKLNQTHPQEDAHAHSLTEWHLWLLAHKQFLFFSRCSVMLKLNKIRWTQQLTLLLILIRTFWNKGKDIKCVVHVLMASPLGSLWGGSEAGHAALRGWCTAWTGQKYLWIC